MSGRRPRVVYWFESPRPYIVERFNAVHDTGKLDFEAWFNTEREPERSWSVDTSGFRFPWRWIRPTTLGGRTFHAPLRELCAVRPDLFVSEYDRAQLVLGFMAASAASRRTAFRVLPNFDSWSERTWWRELGKHVVFRAVDAAKVPGPDGRQLAQRYGLPGDRVFEVTQSIDVDRYAGARSVPPADRDSGRRALGLDGCVVIYVGRLWAGKGLDQLVDAYARLRGEGLAVNLLLVGDGVDEARYRQELQRIGGAAFAGFVQPRELPRFFGLADVLAFPTLGDPNGLVIEEAMAAGLPVVVSDAAGDVRRRVPEGIAGFVVPVGDADALTDRLRRLVTSPETRRELARNAYEIGGRMRHERYAQDFIAFVHGALRLPRRHTIARYACEGVGASLRAVTGALSGGEQHPLPRDVVQHERARP